MAILFVANIFVWFQLNGQLKWDWWKENTWMVCLMGMPISYAFFKATEYGYKVFVVSSTVGKEISNSSNKIGSILSNFNEVIGFASIVPKIPSYVKTIGSTSKLIFTGAKTKKIKDDKNLGDALDELDLSA